MVRKYTRDAISMTHKIDFVQDRLLRENEIIENILYKIVLKADFYTVIFRRLTDLYIWRIFSALI